ncbi:hypothetical protein Tco_0109477 [Tanacetum coccineum]
MVREDPRESFNELMDTPLDFSAFVMNRLKVDTLTPELLTGLTFELMKGSCKSLIELEYFLEEVYKATIDQLDWINPEGQQYPHDLESHIGGENDNNSMDLWLTRNLLEMSTPNAESLLDDDKLYKFKEGDFNRLRIQDIEDMLLLLVQGKLINLTIKERIAFNNKDKKNILMRIDELHKFSDGTLNDVRTALDDRLKGIQNEVIASDYLRQSDKRLKQEP